MDKKFPIIRAKEFFVALPVPVTVELEGKGGNRITVLHDGSVFGRAAAALELEELEVYTGMQISIATINLYKH